MLFIDKRVIFFVNTYSNEMLDFIFKNAYLNIVLIDKTIYSNGFVKKRIC